MVSGEIPVEGVAPQVTYTGHRIINLITEDLIVTPRDPTVISTEFIELLFVPDNRLEAPELLIPGKKPIGPVEIDQGHSLAPDFCLLPQQIEQGILRDRVTGEYLTVPAGSIWEKDYVTITNSLLLPAWLWDSAIPFVFFAKMSINTDSSNATVVGTSDSFGKCRVEIISATNNTLGFEKDNIDSDNIKSVGGYTSGVPFHLGVSYNNVDASMIGFNETIEYSNSGGTHRNAGDMYFNLGNLDFDLYYLYGWMRPVPIVYFRELYRNSFQFLTSV